MTYHSSNRKTVLMERMFTVEHYHITGISHIYKTYHTVKTDKTFYRLEFVVINIIVTELV